jgi:hypothetical protein
MSMRGEGVMECRFVQYDANGQVVSSAAKPVNQDTILFTRIACGVDRAYVSFQTKGMTPWDAREAGLFEIPLKKQIR